LESFVAWVERAIDDLPTTSGRSRSTLAPEALLILHGLRDHVTLRADAASAPVRAGGTFDLAPDTEIARVVDTIPFQLIVDDSPSPGPRRVPTSESSR